MTVADSPPSRRAGRLEWLLTALVGLDLGWTTLCLGGYRPETMVVTSLLTGGALLVWLLGRAADPGGDRLHWAGWLFLPFLAYAAANVAVVTPTRWLGWHDWLGWAQIVAIFWVVLNGLRSRGAQATLLAVLGGLGFVAVVMGAYQRFVRPDWLMLGRVQADQFLGRASGPFGIPNSLGALLILLLPLGLALAVRLRAPAVQRLLFGYLATTLAFGLVLTVSRGAWLAFGLALVAWPLLWSRRSWRWRGGAAILVAGALALTALGLARTVPKVNERFEAMAAESGEWTRPIMWRGAWRLFQEHPWFGSGAGSYNVLFERFRPERYQMEPQWAHNDYLNTLSDYGVTGFILWFGAMAVTAGCVLWRRRSRPEPAVRPTGWSDPLIDSALVVGLAAFLLQLFVDFHFKIPALGMAFAAVAAILVRRGDPVEAPPSVGPGRGRRVAALAVAGAVGFGLIAWVTPHYRGEALRYAARQNLDTLWRTPESDAAYPRVLFAARGDLDRALQLDSTNAQAWADLAYANALASRLAPARATELGAEAERNADRALALCPAMWEFWLRRAVAKDVQQKWYEAGDDLQRAMQLSPNRAIIWYFYAYHMSLQPTGLEQAKAAVDLCLRLDPDYQAAQLLRQKLATVH